MSKKEELEAKVGLCILFAGVLIYLDAEIYVVLMIIGGTLLWSGAGLPFLKWIMGEREADS